MLVQVLDPEQPIPRYTSMHVEGEYWYICEPEPPQDELFAITKEFGLTLQRMLDLYKETTKLDEEIIRAKLLPAHDVYLSAQEALDLKVCDYISDLKR